MYVYMKQIQNLVSILFMAIAVSLGSCKVDNYDAPDGILTGSVNDIITGKPIVTEQPDGFRIKYDEISWSATPVSQYFWGKADGTFSNTKLFAGKYTITPVEGAFITPESQTVDISSGKATNVNFSATPYISFSGVTIIKSLTNVIVTFTMTRNVATAATQDYRVFVTDKTPFVGNGVFDSAVSTGAISFSNADLGVSKVVTLDKLVTGKTYYIRIGARCNNPSGRYNFTGIVSIIM
jgi:hypothetical protein